jgi:predicted RNA-binding Zn-ribbon protein involved in translation (DUF1610 family)
MGKKYRDGKALGRNHGKQQRLRINKRRDTSNWTCPHCGVKYRGTERGVQRSRAVHVCPGTDLTGPADEIQGGMTWHV